MNLDTTKDAYFPAFISGLVCGEGNFTIAVCKAPHTKLGYHVRPIFQIELHQNDEPLLRKVKDFFGLGSFCLPKMRENRPNSSPSCRYSVTAINDCLKLVQFFEKNPLIGMKQKAFEVWRECLKIIVQGRHTTTEGFNEIIRIRSNINQVRRPPTFRLEKTLSEAANKTDIARRILMWTGEEERIIEKYLLGAITRREVDARIPRNKASLSNKIVRMRKELGIPK